MRRPLSNALWPALVASTTFVLFPAKVSAQQDAGAQNEANPAADTNDAGSRTGDDTFAESEAAGPARSPVTAPSEEERPAFLRLIVNQIDIEDVFLVLRGADAVVKVGDLEKSGMRIVGGAREKRGEDEMVALVSLAPRVTFAVDERALTLSVTADPSLFEGTVFDLGARRPEGIVYGSVPSGFANYSVTAGDLQNGRGARAYGAGEVGLSLGGHLFYASGQRSPATGDWDRSITNLTFDLRHRLTRLVLGDFTAIGDALGGGRTLGGLSVARNYSLDPYFMFLPSQNLTGMALTPSTVEVYVNGQLVRRESLSPGQFSLQNIPTTSGSGETRVVVKDAFGSVQTVANPYYMALGTLAKGLSDFGYNLGFERLGYGERSWSYGRPELLCRHRYGLTDWLTVGGRVEGTVESGRDGATPYLVSGGPSLSLRLPAGELAALVAGSRQDGHGGGAALLSYSYIGKPLYLQVGARYQTREYVTLSSLPLIVDRQRFDVSTSVARSMSQVASASIQYQATDWWYAGWNHRFTLIGNRTITRWMYAFATFGALVRSGARTELNLFAGLSFAPADRVSLSTTRSDHWGGGRPHGGATQATLQQSLPVGPGLGYRVVATEGENPLNQASVQYQGAHGRIEADYQRGRLFASEAGQAKVSVVGGLVLVGGRLFFTRQNQDAYALIRVPGVEGVHATVSNQPVGTTDRKGDLLIPNLLHYYGNRIGIDDKDIPIDHNIGTVEEVIAPPYRGGMIVTFPVRRVESVSGTVLVKEGDALVVPAYGQIVVTLGTRKVISPLDEAGNFYLEDLVPGDYQAEVQYATGSCTVPLVVKAQAAALVNVGTLTCVASAANPDSADSGRDEPAATPAQGDAAPGP